MTLVVGPAVVITTAAEPIAATAVSQRLPASACATVHAWAVAVVSTAVNAHQVHASPLSRPHLGSAIVRITQEAQGKCVRTAVRFTAADTAVRVTGTEP